jgi:hypothetical protein
VIAEPVLLVRSQQAVPSNATHLLVLRTVVFAAHRMNQPGSARTGGRLNIARFREAQMQRPELPKELRSSAMKVFREFVVLNFERDSRDVAIDATPALMRIQSCKIEAASALFTRAVLVYTRSSGREESKARKSLRGRTQRSSLSQSRGRRKSLLRRASGEFTGGCQLYSQRASGGSDIRMDSVRPPDCKPKEVPRSYTRLNST